MEHFPAEKLHHEANAVTFKNPRFILDSHHLSRTAYLGHLPEGNEKGQKVYSIHAPLPTFASYNNILIYDARPGLLRHGVRKLSRTEVLRISK